MDRTIEHITKHWINFMKKNIVAEDLDAVVRESWLRCKQYEVNYEKIHIERLSKEQIAKKIKENEELINVAYPIMKNLYSIVSGSGFAIILTDKEGCIINIVGDKELISIEDLNFFIGAIWTEKSIGTNAIGTSIFLDKPIQIIGAEHYYVKNHSLTCSSATIHNEKGEIIGCINMSGNYSKAHSHTTGIVVSGAHSIEKQLALIKSNKLLNVIFDSISDGMLVLDEELNIKKTNTMASKILGISEVEILNTNVNYLLRNIESIRKVLNSGEVYHNVDYNFYVKNKRIKCSITAASVLINEKINGIIITFKDEINVHKMVNTIAGFSAKYKFEDIITKNHEMQKTIEIAKKAAVTGCSILIEGPSGTGKELFAQSIHNYSDRCNGPFVAVNCASFPKDLIESELFGYEKGAFTGAAKEGHPGKFELANGGTIFLDEIGELPLDMQSKLLRVLDNNKIIRLGGTYEKSLNVRVIAATNRNLIEEIKNKSFREDLFYRINVMNIKTIPLKERTEDIETLANYFVYKLNTQNPLAFKILDVEYINIIKNYTWPGNVRELRNVVERSYYLCESNNITSEFLYDYIVNKKVYKKKENKKLMTMEEIEKENIKDTIEQCDGDLTKAARILSISRATIYRKIKKYNIVV
ncbi:sigma-54-dependent Fis family transcriptional regulator [Clostridium sp. DJ247]|uniref:sigma-54-dependent Fis family transcriptional regulator n=1 Tax=Clostridium sp. DJ247 TaxID=2726188 RepID=UPI00162AB0B4|nr:sigma 54-interacting transcriptional regulator [Clostridium sp. DJ247]MBC2580376.1 sigma 54-interacting transcriptional regulator [Clostridium sp. DJ247]